MNGLVIFQLLCYCLAYYWVVTSFQIWIKKLLYRLSKVI